MPDLDAAALALAAAAALALGFTKTGVAGMGIVVVPLMAMVFPDDVKRSVGALLPMLLVGDVVAVAYYRGHVAWRLLARLVPWVACGMPLGYLALRYADNATMKVALGGLVLGLAGLRLAGGRLGRWLEARLPRAWWFAALVGVLAGFATTLANAAGSIMSVYLLVQRLEKREFIGTGAVFYLVVNLLKVGPYAHLGLITRPSLVLDACLAPLILAGAGLGIVLLPRIPQRLFEWLVLGLAVAASVRLMVP